MNGFFACIIDLVRYAEKIGVNAGSIGKLV